MAERLAQLSVRVEPDDEVYRVRMLFLAGAVIPPLRYATYAVGFVFVAAFTAFAYFVFGGGFFRHGLPAVLWLLIPIGLTTLVMRLVDHERPMRTVPMTTAAEIAVPRAKTPPPPVRPAVRKVRCGL